MLHVGKGGVMRSGSFSLLPSFFTHLNVNKGSSKIQKQLKGISLLTAIRALKVDD